MKARSKHFSTKAQALPPCSGRGGLADDPESPTGNPLLLLSAFAGFLAVAMGALGAHALKGRFNPEEMTWFKTAWEYHLVHALAIAVLAMLRELRPQRHFTLVMGGWLFGLGILFFSGSLYALSLGAPAFFAHVTPIGGLALLSGWVCLGMGGRKP